MECVKCVCVWLGAGLELWGKLWGEFVRGLCFWLYQTCRNRGSVGHVFGLRWCWGWVGMVWEGVVVLCLCVL